MNSHNETTSSSISEQKDSSSPKDDCKDTKEAEVSSSPKVENESQV